MEVTLLSQKQIKGDDALEVIKKYGPSVGVTDLATLTGAYSNAAYMIREQDDRIHTGYAWTITQYQHSTEFVTMVTNSGECEHNAFYPYRDRAAIRPVLPPEETKKLTPTATKTGPNGVTIVELGEYPQMLADENTAKQLEKAFRSDSLKKTGKKYTLDSFIHIKEKREEGDAAFKPKAQPEYRYNGKRYICVVGNPQTSGATRLSTFTTPKSGERYWVEVKPIEWLKDPSGYWVSMHGLLSGISFNNTAQYNGDFTKTQMYNYLKKYFVKECFAGKYSDELIQEIEQGKSSLTNLSEKSANLLKKLFTKHTKSLQTANKEMIERDLNKQLQAKKPNRKRLRLHNVALGERILDLQDKKADVLKSLVTSQPGSSRHERAKLIKEQHKAYGSQAAIEMNKYLKGKDNLGADERKAQRQELSSIGANIQKSKAQQKSIIDKLTASTKARKTRAGEILKAQAEVVKQQRAVEEAQKAVDIAKAEYKAFIRKTLKDNVK